LQPVFHTEMQRIDGNAQSPLQLARVDDSIDPNFNPAIMIEVIERGSAVHCVSAYEGDIVILGTDGVFDNLFIDEVVAICDEMLFQPCGRHQKFKPLERSLLGEVARRIVLECHAKTNPMQNGNYRDSPIGKGGKVDDTSCVVGEVVEWTEEHGEAWSNLRRRQWFRDFFTCGGALPSLDQEIVLDNKDKYEYGTGARVRNYPTKPNASFSTYWGSFSEYSGSNYGASSFNGAAWQQQAGKRSFAQYPRALADEEESEEEEGINCSIM